MRYSRPCLTLALCLCWLGAAATPTSETEWMALMLEGQKTGWLKSVRTVHEDRVEHEETVHIALRRSGVAIELTTVDRTVETREGRPLSFSSVQEIAGGSMRVEGEVDTEGNATVRTISGGSEQTQEFTWPAGALLPEGLRLATLAHGLEPGTTFTTSAFIASSLQAADVEVRVVGPERVDLFGVEMDLTRTEQVMDLGTTTTTVVGWVDEDLSAKKMEFSIMGMTLETIACPEDCALAEAQPAEFFTQAFASAPRSLSERMLDDGLEYILRPTGEIAIHFPTGSEQAAQALDDGTFRVRVDPGTTRRPATIPEASPYLGQTRWLQSQAPEVMALLAQAGGVTDDPVETMHRLEAFVRDYVSDKNLSVGYATALETARSRSGDCTEHALLLAALGRSAGIPTRVATGLAYVENWLGARNVFVPHAWTQALIDGRWVSFDAALYGFDAGHLALSFGDGDPWNFYDGVNTLGNFEIVSIEALPE